MNAAEWTIACRDEHLKQVGATTIWEAMRTIGVRGVEVMVDFDGTCPHLFGSTVTRLETVADACRLRDEALSAGVQVTALCLLNQVDERREAEVAYTARMAEMAVALQAPAVRVDFMPRRMKTSSTAYAKLATSIGRQIVAATQQLPVRFGIENHGGANRREFLVRVLNDIPSERFGVTLDTANFYWYGYPLDKLYEIYAEFASCVVHTHCKSIAYPPEQQNADRPIGWEYGQYACPVDQGDIDFRRVAGILKQAGYTGDWCIENESLGRFPAEQRGAVLKREAEHLRRIVAG